MICMSLTNNSLAFIALCNEYCATLENCMSAEPRAFIAEMLRLLPRIYISASDISHSSLDEGYIDPALDEDSYETIRRNVAAVIGKDDTYLEVFEEDMKYSDTPIGASVSEGLADLFQVFYNFLETVRDAPEELADEALGAIREDFATYWAQILCNVMRPLNSIYYNSTDNDD